MSSFLWLTQRENLPNTLFTHEQITFCNFIWDCLLPVGLPRYSTSDYNKNPGIIVCLPLISLGSSNPLANSYGFIIISFFVQLNSYIDQNASMNINKEITLWSQYCRWKLSFLRHCIKYLLLDTSTRKRIGTCTSLPFVTDPGLIVPPDMPSWHNLTARLITSTIK